MWYPRVDRPSGKGKAPYQLMPVALSWVAQLVVSSLLQLQLTSHISCFGNQCCLLIHAFSWTSSHVSCACYWYKASQERFVTFPIWDSIDSVTGSGVCCLLLCWGPCCVRAKLSFLSKPLILKQRSNISQMLIIWFGRGTETIALFLSHMCFSGSSYICSPTIHMCWHFHLTFFLALVNCIISGH